MINIFNVSIESKKGLLEICNESRYDLIVFSLPLDGRRKPKDLFLVKAGQSYRLDYPEENFYTNLNRLCYRFSIPEIELV